MTVRILHGDCIANMKTLPDDSVVAYCAGVIDSDGTIGIKRITYHMRVRMDSSGPTFMARICVRQVERGAVDLLRETFGGAIRVVKPSTPNGRQLFSWEISNKVAESALRAIVPHLRIKRQQAENCLHLRGLIAQSKVARVLPGRGHIGGAHRPPELTALMEATYQKAHDLNRVGAR